MLAFPRTQAEGRDNQIAQEDAATAAGCWALGLLHAIGILVSWDLGKLQRVCKWPQAWTCEELWRSYVQILVALGVGGQGDPVQRMATKGTHGVMLQLLIKHRATATKSQKGSDETQGTGEQGGRGLHPRGWRGLGQSFSAHTANQLG